MRSAVDAGITFFDTADMYSLGASEEVTGQLLGEMFADRDDYVLATKVFNPMGDGPNDRGLSRKHIMASIDASLRRLGTDHVDLYQIHRFDHETPIEETMEALHDVVRAGKARYIGASSMYAWQFAKAQHVADLQRLDAVRVHAEPLQPPLSRGGAGDAPATALDQGVGVIPWSPLARGRLAGPAARRQGTVRAGSDTIGQALYAGAESGDRAIVDAVEQVAKARGLPMAQIALAWLLHRGVTAPIVGATKPGHIEDAVASVDVELSTEEMEALEAPYVPHPVAGHA